MVIGKYINKISINISNVIKMIIPTYASRDKNKF